MGGRRGRSIAFRLPRAPTALSPCLQLGARGPAAPGCAPLAGLHSDAAGASGTPSSAASPGGRGLKASRGILRATKETWFLQPLASASLHTPPRDLGGGGGLGRERGWRRSGLKGSIGTRRKGLRDLEKSGAGVGVGLGLGGGGGETRAPSLLSGARGPLPRGTPHPAAPNLQNKGSGSKAGVREWRWREAGDGGREGASLSFLSRPKYGKLLPADTSPTLLHNREGSGSLPKGGTRSLPPPASPPPPGTALGSCEAAVRGGGGRNREAAAPPAGAGRPRSHRAALALKVEPGGSTPRVQLFGSPGSAAASFPREAGLTVGRVVVCWTCCYILDPTSCKTSSADAPQLIWTIAVDSSLLV